MVSRDRWTDKLMIGNRDAYTDGQMDEWIDTQMREDRDGWTDR